MFGYAGNLDMCIKTCTFQNKFILIFTLQFIIYALISKMNY